MKSSQLGAFDGNLRGQVSDPDLLFVDRFPDPVEDGKGESNPFPLSQFCHFPTGSSRYHFLFDSLIALIALGEREFRSSRLAQIQP
jgi:hypothetical protein